MSYTTKPFEELDIMDDFLMNATADDEEVGEEFSRTLLYGLLQKELGKIQVSVQKVMIPNTPNHRGIRLDVEVNEYEDGLTFIYFNTTGTKGGNQSIKKLLNYIEDSTINNVTDEVTKKLHDCISKVKVLPEVRMEYMKWDAMIFYERRDAKNEGKIEGKIEAIFDCLEELGTISGDLQEKIKKETDLEQIKRWLKVAMKVNSIEEFIEKM